MFKFFKPKTQNKNQVTKTLKLSGLHCTSCAVNIDLSLEDLPSVSSKTNYAKSETIVTYDTTKTKLEDIVRAISDLGYKIEN